MIAEVLRHRAETAGDRAWLVMLEGQELRTRTFGEAWHDTRRYAVALRRRGVGPGARVALAPRNTAPDVLTALACLALGAHVWMLNPDDPPERLRRQLDSRLPDVVLGELPGADPVLPCSPTDPAVERFITVATDGAAPALMFNTSGSTGVPKAVVQSHAAVLANARSFTAHHRLAPGRTVLGFLPIHHVNAVHSNLMASLHSGATCVLLRPDSLLRLHRWIETTEPYLVSLVPSAADALLTSWRRPSVPDRLHHVLTAASPLSTRTAREFHARFGRRIVQGYGLSETMNFSTTVPVDLDEQTYARVALEVDRPSIGCAIADVDVRVCDGAGEALPDDEIGELAVRGPHLMTAYDGDPEATAEVLRDGWFRTGDLGFQRTEPGVGAFFYLTGRAKNVAKVRGEQISLEEVENALVSLSGVRDAVCAGEPDERGEERIVAGVVLDPGADVADVARRSGALLPPYGVPSRWVRLDRVPRTPTGKILRPDSLTVIHDAAQDPSSTHSI